MADAHDRGGTVLAGPPAFVGRNAALGLLARWWRDAAAGQPRVVLLAGEAGIGKSRLLAHFAASVAEGGSPVLSGVCHERLGVPYLPLATALAGLTDLVADDEHARRGLAALLAAGDAVLDPTASRVDVDAAAGGVAAGRLAAFVDLAEALLDATAERPLLLTIDDLHWADPASAELLLHLLTAVAHRVGTRPVRLLAVVAHRPGEAAGAAAQTLERLGREEITREIGLTGLSEVETNELLHRLGPVRPSRPLLASIHAASGGNPLVVRSTWISLLATDAIRRRGEEMVSVDPAAVDLAPADASHAMLARIERLEGDVRDLLVDAVVLGDGHPPSLLAALRDVETAEVEALLSRLLTSGLLTLAPGTGTVRLDHPEVAAAALLGLPTGARAQRHARVVERLAPAPSGAAPALAAGTDVRDEAPSLPLLDLARHALAAGDRLAPHRSFAVAAPAADRAFAVGAWDASARYYDLAVAALDRAAGVVPLDAPANAGDVLTRLLHRGLVAHFRNHDASGIRRVGDRLAALARDAGDVDLWAEAVMVVTRAALTLGTETLGFGADEGPLLELLDALGDDRPLVRGKVLGELAELHFNAWDFEGGSRWAGQARQVLEQTSDDDLGARIEFAQGLQHLGRLELEDAERCFVQSVEHADRLEDPWLRAWGRGRLPAVLWAAGRLAEAERAVDAAFEISEANHDWAEHSLAAAFGAGVAATQGRYADADDLAAVAVADFHRSDYSFTPLVLYPSLAVARALRGNVGGATAAVREWQEIGDGGQGARLAVLCRAMAGAPDAGDDEVVARWRPVVDRDPDLLVAPELAAQVELGVATGRDDLILATGPALGELHRRGVRAVVAGCASIARLLGVVAAAAGRLDEAERWFASAASDAQRWASPAEAARAHADRGLALARLAPHRHAEAREDLERAAATFDRLGMLPLLERTDRALADLPAGSGRPVLDRRIRILLVTDIVDSTRMNVAAGDDRWHLLLVEHDRLVREALRSHGGVEFKHTGDGMLAWFDDPDEALACALGLQQALDDANLAHPEAALRVRCGLAAGQPVPSGQDLFGLAVVRAVRVCAHAGAGEVLVAPEVPVLTGTDRVAFDAGTEVDLKGLPGRHRVHQARWAVPVRPAGNR